MRDLKVKNWRETARIRKDRGSVMNETKVTLDRRTCFYASISPVIFIDEYHRTGWFS
jgi:hypothetical protein